MCGIAAISRPEDRSSIADGHRFAFAMALAIEPRGRHATGFGWADLDGHPWYWKTPGKASRAIFEADLPTHRIHELIAHTRYATLGDPSNNDNNHPVVAEGMTLVHNGRVDNHDELFDLAGRERRIGQVDSECLPLLLTAGLGESHPTDLLELVEGVAAIAWLDADTPGALHLARLAVRPLAIGRTKRGDLLASSTVKTLSETARLGGVALRSVEQLPQGTYLRVEAGEIVERRSFDVRTPIKPVPDDRPTASKKARPQATHVMSHDEWLWDRELVDGREIDWDNLAPRRGWK
jgi:glucosamine 6-phosphate synthetase-like amidotransferase/phosphosugar isomerase protein